MAGRKEKFLNVTKQKCIAYCMKKGLTKQKAEKVAQEYELTGLEFPDELLIGNEIFI